MKPVAVPVAIPAACGSVGNYEITCTWGESLYDQDILIIDGFKYTVDNNEWGGGSVDKDGVTVAYPQPETSVGMAVALAYLLSVDAKLLVDTMGSNVAYVIPNTNKVIVRVVESCVVTVNTNNAFVVKAL